MMGARFFSGLACLAAATVAPTACAPVPAGGQDRDIIVRFRSLDVIQAEGRALGLRDGITAFADWGKTPCEITMRQPLARYLNDFIQEDHHCKAGAYHPR